MDDVVTLFRRHPQLCWHLIRPLPHGFVKAERIVAVLERLFPEGAGRRECTLLLRRAVTSNANGCVKLFAARQALRIPLLDDRRVRHPVRGDLPRSLVGQSHQQGDPNHYPHLVSVPSHRTAFSITRSGSVCL